jgi:hypothetical protein
VSAPASVPAGTVAIQVGAYVALIDEADLELVSGYNWRPMKSKSGKIYAFTAIGGKTIGLHRLILGTDSGLDTDHRDGNPLNNRRNNLRPATHAQNMANKAAHRNNKSGLKGVHRAPIGKGGGRPWRATIQANKQRHFLGTFATAEQAARAYDEAARKHHGEFGRPNFPGEVTA